MPDRAIPGEQSCLCWQQNAGSRDCLCFWELPGTPDKGHWRWMLCAARAAVCGSLGGGCRELHSLALSDVLEAKISQVQPHQELWDWAGVWGWMAGNSSGRNESGTSQECSLESGSGSHREVRAQLPRSLWETGVRELREVSAGSRLQESFSFVPSLPAKGKCFCGTRAALAKKDPNKPI